MFRSNYFFPKFSSGLFICLFIFFTKPLISQQTWNLAEDWNWPENPNGPWTYREGLNALPSVDNWNASSPPQPAYAVAETGTSFLPVWFKAVADADEWIAGDVITHVHDNYNGVGNGQANVIWTSQGSYNIDITGSLWIMHYGGRSVRWTLFLNDDALALGDLFDGDGIFRVNPQTIASGAIISEDDLKGIDVEAGDVVKLVVERTSQQGFFAGANLEISETTYPPLAPQNLIIISSYPNVSLQWDAVTENTNGDPISSVSYNVYAGIIPDFTLELVNFLETTSGLTYNHEDGLVENRMFYKVTAVHDGVVSESTSSKGFNDLLKGKD